VIDDPTTAAVMASNDEREQLRDGVSRLERALVAAYTEIDAVKADRDRLNLISKRGDTMFVEGYNQAVREIRDHFAKAKEAEVVAEIEKIWLKDKLS
jgi:hypothetical protein